MNRLCLSAALSALAVSATFADAVVTNSWIYVKDQALTDGRWCSYWYKNQWSLEAEPTADQIVEFGPGNATVANSLAVFCRETASDKTLEKLPFPANGFTSKGIVMRYPASAPAWIDQVSFSDYLSNWFELQLGSEGVTMLGAGDAESTRSMPSIYGASPLTLTTSQTWRIGSSAWKTLGSTWSTLGCDLKSAPDVTWRILGKGTIRFCGLSADGGRIMSREGGTSKDFGGKVFANAFLMMEGASQVARLGTNSVEITCETVDGQRAFPGLRFRFGESDDTSWTPVAFAAPLVLTATNPSIYDGSSTSLTALPIVAEERHGLRAWVSFPKGIGGTFCDKGLLFGYDMSGADGGGVYPGRMYAMQMRRDTVRFVLDGDNSGLVPQHAGDQILLTTVVMPATANALGANNAIDLVMPQLTSWASFTPSVLGVIASNGVTVASNIRQSGSHYTHGVHAAVVIGSEGAGNTRFTGEIQLSTSGSGENFSDMHYNSVLVLTADKGGSATLEGKVTSLIRTTVNGTGDVRLSNAANVLNKANGIGIRSGRLIAGANGAVGHGVIRVGEAAPVRYTVRAVQTSRFARNSVKVTLSPDDGVTPTKAVFTAAPTVDGVTLKKGDLVLMASQDYFESSTILDGVFEVTSDDAKTWTLKPEFDGAAARDAAYGIRIHVAEGDHFAGRDFYWAEHMTDREATYRTLGGSNKFAIYDDAAEHPDTGLLADGGVTVANDITVANDGTGKAEIGAATAGTAVFTGSVTVEKPTLEIYAPAGATVQVSGLIRNATGGKLTLVKTGPGKAVLAQLDATVTDIRIADGTLNFTYVDTDAVQPLLHLDAMNDASLTKVTETIGDAEVTSVTRTRWADTRGAAYPYVRSCHDRWAPKVADWPWSVPRHNRDWHYLIATRHPAYVVTTTRPGFDLPTVDLLDAYYYGGNDGVTSVDDMTNQTAALDVFIGEALVPYQEANDSPFKHVREAFVVMKDNETTQKMSLLGTTDSSNVEYYRRGSNGSLITSEAESANVRSGAVKNGRTRVDGETVANVTTEMLPAGFHVVSFCPTGDTIVASLGLRTSRHLGGIQYGEVVLFTNVLTKTEHDAVEAELLAKWLGESLPDAPATVDSLTIDCVFKDGVMTGSLDMGSRFKAAEPCVVNVTCGGVRPEPGDYLLLSAKSVETDGTDWTLNATGLAAKRDYEIVKKADGNLYLRVMARGMCIIFR